MSILSNPVLVSVVVLCLLCLCKLNVLMSLVLSALTGAVLAGISIPTAMSILCDGFGANAVPPWPTSSWAPLPPPLRRLALRT